MRFLYRFILARRAPRELLEVAYREVFHAQDAIAQADAAVQDAADAMWEAGEDVDPAFIDADFHRVTIGELVAAGVLPEVYLRYVGDDG